MAVAEAELKKRNAVALYMSGKPNTPMLKALERQGYTLHEYTYLKYIGD